MPNEEKVICCTSFTFSFFFEPRWVIKNNKESSSCLLIKNRSGQQEGPQSQAGCCHTGCTVRRGSLKMVPRLFMLLRSGNYTFYKKCILCENLKDYKMSILNNHIDKRKLDFSVQGSRVDVCNNHPDHHNTAVRELERRKNPCGSLAGQLSVDDCFWGRLAGMPFHQAPQKLRPQAPWRCCILSLLSFHYHPVIWDHGVIYASTKDWNQRSEAKCPSKLLICAECGSWGIRTRDRGR